ncbi:MAG: HDOD domain-containing protein [Nitrospira sp.]|nr:MAG: HDOD domain-containing protein [Nitrospira sp.]
MKHVLFVDDEQRILDGLRRMFRPMREEWHAVFAPSGQAALDELAKAHFDVVVTDMRMPGMDGVQLLSEVRKRYPSVVRIVLTGQSDRETTLRSLGQTHQCLSKPCDPDELKRTVMRAVALRELLVNESIRSLVAGMQSLPSVPTIYNALLSEIESPKSSMESVANIISQDIGMTGKVLQLVNSAFFGLPKAITNPAQAISLLGLDTVKALVLGIHVFSAYRGAQGSHFQIEALWKHSLATGKLARMIVEQEHGLPNVADSACTAGLLHDVGVMVLAANIPEYAGDILQSAKLPGTNLSDVERERLGATHAEVGAYLLGLWGLGDSIVEAVAFHHAPTQCLNRTFGPLTAVHVANGLVREDLTGKEESLPPRVNDDYLRALGLADRLPRWRELYRRSLEMEVAHD